MKGWKKIYHANIKQKKGGVAKIISNKVGFRANKIIRDRQRGTLYNEEKINPPRRHGSPKCVCEQHSLKMCKAKTDRTERAKRQISNYSWRLQYPSVNS